MSKTRTKLIEQLREPIDLAHSYTEFKRIAAKVDLVAEALAVLLTEQRPS
jgi:hypothetical protein